MSANIRRATAEPRFLRDYAEKPGRVGEGRFAAQHGHPVLLGIGMVGELADSKQARRRTHDMVGSEEYVPVQSLLDRIWPIRQCDHPISARYITLGHDADCDVIIPEYTLSSNHCAFSRSRPRKIADLGSLNGTYVDDTLLPPRKPMALRNGAELTLGRLKLKYHSMNGFISELYGFLGDR